MKRKIRSKHNDLLNYFIHDERDLSRAYVRKCERFLWSLRNKGLITKKAANTLYRLQASSSKRQAWLNNNIGYSRIMKIKEAKAIEEILRLVKKDMGINEKKKSKK